jgi:hypothetical protein
LTSPVGVPIALAARESPNQVREYTRAVRSSCRRWIGRGELPGQNNRGGDVDELLAIAGVGQRDKHGRSKGGPWCGVGSSAQLVLGARHLVIPCPIQVHAGAKALGRNTAAAGSYVIEPRGWTVLGGGTFEGVVDPERLAGALIVVWHRGTTRETAWSGHVEIVLGYDAATDTLITWAPNVDPIRADGRVRDRDAVAQLAALGITCAPGQALTHVRFHRAGSWRRKLYCVSTLAG